MPRTQPLPFWLRLQEATLWAVACAVGAAVVWGIGLLVGQAFLKSDISKPPAGSAGETALLLAALGAVFGTIVGMLGAAVWLRPRFRAAVFWGVLLAVAVPIGGVLSVAATVEFKEILPSQVSSSLGFAVAGLLVGWVGYIWKHWKVDPVTDAIEDDEETPATELPAEQTRAIPVTVGNSGTVVRFLPVPAVSVLAFIATGVIYPDLTSLALLAVGFLGFAATATLWDHELRLRELERRFSIRRQQSAESVNQNDHEEREVAER